MQRTLSLDPLTYGIRGWVGTFLTGSSQLLWVVQAGFLQPEQLLDAHGQRLCEKQGEVHARRVVPSLQGTVDEPALLEHEHRA